MQASVTLRTVQIRSELSILKKAVCHELPPLCQNRFGAFFPEETCLISSLTSPRKASVIRTTSLWSRQYCAGKAHTFFRCRQRPQRNPSEGLAFSWREGNAPGADPLTFRPYTFPGRSELPSRSRPDAGRPSWPRCLYPEQR